MNAARIAGVIVGVLAVAATMWGLSDRPDDSTERAARPLLEAVPTSTVADDPYAGVPNPWTEPLDYTDPTTGATAPAAVAVEREVLAPAATTTDSTTNSGLRFDRYEPQTQPTRQARPVDNSPSGGDTPRPGGIDGAIVRSCLDAIQDSIPQGTPEFDDAVLVCIGGGIVRP